MNLSLFHSTIISPIILGSQLAIPFGIITSAFLLNENISKNKWLLIFTSFFGILIIFFDPKLSDNFLGLFYASLMALFFGLAQVYSRQLKELDTSIINVSTGLFGFVILIIVSSVIEGETINSIKLINLESWILIFYQAIIVSLCAHLLMFYLYKFYTVGKIFPFYSLFPIFGICLGHQILALALNCKTYKLKCGHHGGNHPVKDYQTNKIEITSHNHGFSVDEDSLPEDVRVTHRNLNDQTVEGLESLQYPAYSVQYHPEAAPGPRDARYLFKRFVGMMGNTKRRSS